LRDFCHVGHGAAGVEVGEDRDLAGAGEDVSAFGHEMHAAENDVSSASLGGLPRKLVGVAPKISEANNLISLVVMSENQHFAAERLLGREEAVFQNAIRKFEITLQTANFGRSAHVHNPLSAPKTYPRGWFAGSTWNGDVESYSAAPAGSPHHFQDSK